MKDKYEIRSTAAKLELRQENDANIIEGYAAVFGNVDSYGTTFDKVAFNRTIAHREKDIKILWQHSWYEPLGVPTKFSVDDYGLHMKARISDTTLGRDALQLVKDGVVDGLSVGFQGLDYEWRDDVLVYKEVKLWEVSLVTFPANELARITKSNNPAVLEELSKFEKILDSNLSEKDLRQAVKMHAAQLRAILAGEPTRLAEKHAAPEAVGERADDLAQTLLSWRVKQRREGMRNG